MSDPVVIIGAGPAGLSCASELAAAGRSVCLIDDNASAGGQYFRQLPPTYIANPDAKLLRDKARFDELAQVLVSPNVKYMPSTVVWGMPDRHTIAYAGPANSGRVSASAIVIATGAQEKSMPFTGWTLPGIISAGGCLNLAKGHGLVPSGKVVVAGNGPLVLVAAATLLAAGANVVAVIEAQSDSKLLSVALEGARLAPAILAKGIGYRARMLKAGLRMRTGWMVCEARGKEALEAVCIAPVGSNGRPEKEKSRWIDADTLVVGYGLLAGSETARMFECAMENSAELNGVVPRRDERLSTSVDRVYAIGDGAGIGGVEVAILEGRIAASSILGREAAPQDRARYGRLDRYRRKLNIAYSLPHALVAAESETIICRCEELTLAKLSADSNSGRDSLNALKTSTRLGMGRCQGRTCLHVASAIFGFNAEAGPTFPRVRPPLRPVTVERIAADADVGPARVPDENTTSNIG